MILIKQLYYYFTILHLPVDLMVDYSQQQRNHEDEMLAMNNRSQSNNCIKLEMKNLTQTF